MTPAAHHPVDPIPRRKSATVSNTIARPQPPPRGPGLFTVPGQNDRYLGDLGFNWRHRFAVPACCILILLSPFAVLWAFYASLMRWRGRRYSRRCNAAFLAAHQTRTSHHEVPS